MLNKKKFPEIKLNGGTDRMLATLKGELLTYKNVPQVKIPIWQYDSMFRTKKIIAEDRARFARAWYRTFNNYGNNIVLWNNNNGKIFERYYYIFKLDELKNLFNIAELDVIDYEYNCGNEVFTLMRK